MRHLFPLLAFAPLAVANDVRFPADAGIVDVTKPPYSAKGGGKTDDTKAIQQALEDHPAGGAIIYLPNGTYLVSDTLKWPQGPRGGLEQKNTILQGQSRDKAVLKLADKAAGFDDPKKRKAVLWTGQKPAQRFRNAVRTITIDTGRGNPGASGVQFMANNQGGMFDVLIRSGDGSGVAGLDMAYTDEIGPLLVRNVEVVGFDHGILCGFAVDSMTFENVVVKDQKVSGFENRGQVVSIRGLTSVNAVPAVRNTGGGLMTLIDAELVGGKDGAAIVSPAPLFARSVKSGGYRHAVEQPKKDAESAFTAGPNLDEFTTREVSTLFDVKEKRSLNLPIKDAPEVPWGDVAKDWTSPLQHGYDPKDRERPAKAPQNWQPKDASEALQKAIDSGATTVYLPRSLWMIGKTVVLRGKCRRLIGCEATVDPLKTLTGPMFRVEDGDGESVIIERIRGGYVPSPDVRFEHATKRAVVLRNVTVGRTEAGCYRNTPGAGPLFLDDVVGGGFVFTKQEVYCRQLNAENDTVKVTNDGGTLWILGLKTERKGTLVETTNGGRTEVLGCFCYTTAREKHDAPMFVCVDSAISVTAGETCFTGKPFPVVVRETRKGEAKELAREDAKGRPNGSLLTLFVSGR
jgi:hypothetical protein